MECPQVGRGGVFRQITSNRFQTCTLRIALCISCMIKINKCFGKGFGWICALNRWSVQERAQTSFCPIARQILHYLAWELYRQIAAWYLSIMTPFYLLWGVRKGGWGGGAFWAGGPKFTRDCRRLFFFYVYNKKRVPICSFYKQASICILINIWNRSVAELRGKNWDMDAHEHMTYQAPITGLHTLLPFLQNSTCHIASISSEFHWPPHAGTIL